MADQKKPEGFDLVDVEPRFGKETKEEFWERCRKRHFEVYGDYPETPPGLNENSEQASDGITRN